MEPNRKIHKYFQVGDIVVNESIWGNMLFIIHSFGGNTYLPEAYVHRYGKPNTTKHSCNWDIRETTLVDSPKRPFRKFKKELLLKLLKKGNVEAKREFIIRANKKKYHV